MNNLECSSKGDKRFSALYSKVLYEGKLSSIESIYQKSKRRKDGSVCKKGEYVEYMVINNNRLESRFLTPFYKLLWVKYFDNNPELVEYAKDFDSFSDMFRGRSINVSSDIIEKIVKSGRSSVMDECIELLDILN